MRVRSGHKENFSVRFDGVADDTAVAVGTNRRQRVDCALEAIEGVTLSAHDHFKRLVIFVLANFACGLVTPIILGAITVVSHTGNLISSDFANTRGTAAIDLFLFFGFLLGIWAVPRFGRIRMQAIGFAGMTLGMLILMIAVRLSNSGLHIPLVFVGFILFNLLMNAGPNATTFTLAPILFPTQLRGTAGGFAAGVAKLGATLGVFLLPILKEKFGVPSVLGIVSAVSLLGLVVTLILGREDTE
jgi:MFS transporter, putative metabolite transport protein